MSSYTFTYTCPNEECEADIPCTMSPGREPPPCRNPSSPAYSDCGDPGYVECPDTCPQCGAKLDEDMVYEAGEDKLAKEGPDCPDF